MTKSQLRHSISQAIRRASRAAAIPLVGSHKVLILPNRPSAEIRKPPVIRGKRQFLDLGLRGENADEGVALRGVEKSGPRGVASCDLEQFKALSGDNLLECARQRANLRPLAQSMLERGFIGRDRAHEDIGCGVLQKIGYRG